MSLSPSHDSSSHSSSAIIFSSDLIHHLENSCRLPSTYIGVRQIRPTFTCDGGSVGASSSNDRTRKRKRNDSSSSSFGNNNNDDDDAWVSNNNCNVRIQSTVDNDTQHQQQPETTSNSGNTSTDIININSNNEVTRDVISYKVTNPDGTQRRMTTQEKKQLKYKLNLVKQQARKDERQRQHKQRILDAKEGKKERKRLKRSLASWKIKKQQQNDQQQNEEGLDDVMITNCIGMNDTQDWGKFEHQSTFCKINQQPDDWGGQDASTIDDAESTSASVLRGEVKDVPPVMLTPAATCIARDMDLLSSQCCGGESKQSTTTTTCGRQTPIIIMDSSLSLQWATQLQQSMIPAETTRGKEDMRPMAYKIVPEVWKRLCPETVVDSGAQKEEGVDKSKKRCDLSLDKAKAIQLTSSIPTTHHGHSNNDSSSQELVILRNPSPSHDTDACIIFKYLHTTYPNLHIACGAVFGCDFLLYNGKRDATHSFAGLRIYSCCRHNSSHATIRSNNITGEDGVLPQQQQLPIPTAYDMTGFVRTMNTAKKIALVATVVREEATTEDERSDDDVTITSRVAIVDLALKKVL